MMDEKLLKEVKECLCGERTLFYYHPDQYAIYLMQRLLTGRPRVAINALRNSPWAGLLRRPALQDVVSQCGAGYLSHEILQLVYNNILAGQFSAGSEPYVLTLGEWGGKNGWAWNQTSRPGKNLVLQLNLSKAWAVRFRRVTGKSVSEFFDSSHPVSETRTVTLAWARLDLDFDTDEALIEEVQSDLVRDIMRMQKRAELAKRRGSKVFHYYYSVEVEGFLDFAHAFLRRFKKHWQEVMLSAAIGFVFDELGLSRLYYHSFETGNKMKNLRWSCPPRSLYTDLPKKFCFGETEEAPTFLRQDKRLKRKLKTLQGGRWFHMAA